MRRTAAILLCLSVALAGCKAKELAEKAEISKDLEKRGTTDLMKEVANDTYDPPADGRLTDAQVKMYLKVREHEKKIAVVAKEEMKQHAANAEKSGEKSLSGMMDSFKALGSAADFMTADIRAAKDLGFNSQEYLWVKGQILAASTAEMGQKFNETIQQNVDKAYADAKKAYDEAQDETTKKMYGETLAMYEKQRQEMTATQDTDPALAFNREMVKKYGESINAFAQELSKYEEKPGDVQKAVDDFNQKAEEAKKQ
jgi:hypothetical protein